MTMRTWKDLSIKEQHDWLHSGEPNGCGAKGGWIKPPKAIFFKASCNIHDWGYSIGQSEEDRKKIDQGFLKYMLLDCNRIKNPVKRYRYKIWANAYYIGVRVFGKRAFYKKFKIDLSQ